MKITSTQDQALYAVNRSQNHEFAQLKNKALDKSKVKEVAQEFESLFIEMMFKEMKKTVNKSSLSDSGNPGQDIFDDMLYTEYAKETSKTGGFGLAKMIELSLSPHTPAKKVY